MITIDGMVIDAALREEHSFEADVSEHPVESGADVTDHVRARPPVVSIEGIVSDTPLADDVIAARTAGETPSVEARARLFDIWNRREPITVETTVAVYTNMVMQSFSITEDADTGEACRFRATLKQIRLVKNKRTTVRVASPSGSRKVNLGSRPSPEVTDGGGGAQSPPLRATRDASQAAQHANRISLFNSNGTSNYGQFDPLAVGR